MEVLYCGCMDFCFYVDMHYNEEVGRQEGPNWLLGCCYACEHLQASAALMQLGLYRKEVVGPGHESKYS